MLAGGRSSCTALFTASTASPSAALGARLNENVITGNWPWWLMVMGAAIICSLLNAASGTWLNIIGCGICAGGVPNSALDAMAADVGSTAVGPTSEVLVVVPAPGVPTAAPRPPAVVPPDTKPVAPPVPPADVRM